MGIAHFQFRGAILHMLLLLPWHDYVYVIAALRPSIPLALSPW
jgi:hypothetical protein